MAIQIHGADIVKLAQQALAEHWAYILGRNGDHIVTADDCKRLGLDTKWIGHNSSDCSGLWTWINRQLKTGYGDAHASGWYDRCKKLATIHDLQAGDFLGAADASGHVYHCGVYIGNNEYIDNPCPAIGIREKVMPEKWNRFGRMPFVVAEPRDPRTVMVTCRSLNVRSGSGITFPILGVVHSGDELTTTGNISNGWEEIVWKTGTAWVSGKYVV